MHIVAQPLGIALALDLRAHASMQFVRVDRAQEIVVDANLEPAHQPRIIVRLAHRQYWHVAGAVQRTKLAAKSQTVEFLKAERDDNQFVIALGRAK